MHRCATCKVQTTHSKGPSLRVPGPAGDRVVDDGGPDEDEDEHGSETGTFGETAYGEHWAVVGESCLVGMRCESGG